ncbi:A1S_1983 family putative colistin resistance protein [Acinetobacter sp. MD2(2019)]|uniref:A1S_1983 family putative colistin resistance protein n=1 Tax=Acinetobacter sp. MD2(2019) TaxID=2605273 RepID=UPI002D1ED121|nr:hypothetical protein [Acinetobacter sp. MD2(2019)]MEB3752963.1 hypothetical protein [Acinetobacter sp. MD2(2019)]
MSLKFALNFHKTCLSIFGCGFVLLPISGHAQNLDCMFKVKQHLLCSANNLATRQQLNQLLFTTYMTSNAPTPLIHTTQNLWRKRVEQCKSKSCVERQFELRNEDLNTYNSINQNLTQHFIQYRQGYLAKPTAYLQIHQLDQNRIKIEGIAYRNPNNSQARQSINFLAYRNQAQKNEITNNETGCKYAFNYQKAILTVTLLQNQAYKYCDRFVGIYKLYD